MDTDWCLSCGQHLPSDAPYCSQECMSHDRPSVSIPPSQPFVPNLSSLHSLSTADSDLDIVYHDISKGQWLGSDYDGIRAWAANIPLGSSDGTSSSDMSKVSSRASSPPPAARRTPKLLLSNQRPATASLCMSTPHPAFPPPSKPIVTPQLSITSLRLAKSAGDVGSSISSLFSGITDPLIATPSSASMEDPIHAEQEPKFNMPHILDALAVHVRAWVSPPQQKCTSAPRVPKPAVLNLSTPPESHVALHSDFESGSDDSLPHDAWWASQDIFVEKESSVVKRKGPDIVQPRGLRTERDHPAYRARGRKTSRAFAIYRATEP